MEPRSVTPWTEAHGGLGYCWLYVNVSVCLFQIDWAANIRSSWDFSEEGAQSRLEAFLNDGETHTFPFLYLYSELNHPTE